MKDSILTLLHLIKNKCVSWIVFALLVIVYLKLPDNTPFVELLYASITAYGVVLLVPLIRLKVFGEAAAYAEQGGLTADLNLGTVTAKMKHYWFATGVCALIVLACIATIHK